MVLVVFLTHLTLISCEVVQDWSKADVDFLIKKLDANNSRIRKKAADALIKIGEPAVPSLIKSLGHKNWRVRVYAASALADIGKPAEVIVPALIKALDDEAFGVRGKVADALGGFGPAAKTAVPALIERLKTDNDHVCAKAADALGQIGDPMAVPALAQVLKVRYVDYVRGAVATALKRIGTREAMRILHERDKESPRFKTDQ